MSRECYICGKQIDPSQEPTDQNHLIFNMIGQVMGEPVVCKKCWIEVQYKRMHKET